MKPKGTKGKNGPNINDIAVKFVTQYKVISTDGKNFYIFDGQCYVYHSDEHMRHLVFINTPIHLREVIGKIMTNIASRTYRKPEELSSAYYEDENGDYLLNCSNGIIRWFKNATGLWQQKEELEPHTQEILFTGVHRSEL